jgi:DNA-binding SARP family transcriptional activator
MHSVQHAHQPRDASPANLRLSLLSGFRLTTSGVTVAVPLSAQRLLAYLAVHDGSVRRMHVAASLWLDVTEERAGANLRTALWRLRQVGAAVVDASTSQLGLADGVDVDLHDASAHARRLIDRDAPCDNDDLSERGLAADLLPDWYDDWLLLEQEHFRQLRLHALEALCMRLTDLGRFAAAVEAGMAAVAGEPLRESAQRTLIRAHLAEGNPGEALRQFDAYRRLLRDELALVPSRLMRDLVGGLLTDAP